MKRYRRILTIVLLIFCAILFGCVERVITGQLPTQQLADRWSKENDFAQISCFFAKDSDFTSDQVIQVEQSIKRSLEEASQDADNEGNRTWIDCYSTQANLSIASEKTSATVRTFGVGGDFFQFHPLKLLDGNYFNQDDPNEDGVIIDENVAWQLFGSYHVAGMTVEIGDETYYIRGVVRSDSGMYSSSAKEEDATIYVSYDILKKQYENLTLDSYELLVKNPVSQFGMTSLKSALGLDESLYEIVENSTRYDLVNRWNILKNFGVRSMNSKNIVYPYWENRARAYEDVSVLLLVIEFLCLVYPFLWLCKKVYWLWKHKDSIKQAGIEKSIMFWKAFRVWLKKAKTVNKAKISNKTKTVNKETISDTAGTPSKVQNKKNFFVKKKN